MDNEPDRAWNKEMHGLIREMIHFRNETLLSCDPDPEKISGFEERYLKILETARKEYEDIPANVYYKDGYNLFLRMENICRTICCSCTISRCLPRIMKQKGF